MRKGKEIDYLFEDPEIPSQKFALVSIVGPHFHQKCDVWGLKVRGIADTMEKAKSMSQKLMKIDNNYDIYTVDVGKFFPLAIDPLAVGNVEYQNEQLNTLVKSYLENRDAANDQWHERKNDMIQQAIKEGKEQATLVTKPEHPIAVLQRMKSYEEQIKEIQDMLEDVKEKLSASQEKFNNYSQDEKDLANNELLNAVESNVNTTDNSELKIEEIRDQFVNDLVVSSSSSDGTTVTDMKTLLEEINQCENEISHLEKYILGLNKDEVPTTFFQTSKSKEDLEVKLGKLKQKLNDKNLVNDFINSNYKDSEYNEL